MRDYDWKVDTIIGIDAGFGPEAVADRVHRRANQAVPREEILAAAKRAQACLAQQSPLGSLVRSGIHLRAGWV